MSGNADTDSHGNLNSDTHCDANGHGNSNSNPNSNSHRDGNGYGDSNCNPDRDSDSYSQCNTDTYSHTGRVCFRARLLEEP